MLLSVLNSTQFNLIPEVQAVNKPVCLMRISNIPYPYGEAIRQSVGTPFFAVVTQLFNFAGYKLELTEDLQFFVIIEISFFNDLFDYAMDNNQVLPYPIGDYLYSKYVEHKGEPA